MPQGDLLEAHSEAWRAMERVGLREVGARAFVLVAGGLGERLGYDGIKVSSTNGKHDGYVLSGVVHQDDPRVRAKIRQHFAVVPHALQGHGSRHTRSTKEHNNFGMRADQISFVVQAGVPALYLTKSAFRPGQ